MRELQAPVRGLRSNLRRKRKWTAETDVTSEVDCPKMKRNMREVQAPVKGLRSKLRRKRKWTAETDVTSEVDRPKMKTFTQHNGGSKFAVPSILRWRFNGDYLHRVMKVDLLGAFKTFTKMIRDMDAYAVEDNLQITAPQVADLQLSSQKLVAPPDGLDQYKLKYTEANPAQGVSSKAMQANAAGTCTSEKKEENLSLVPVRDHKKFDSGTECTTSFKYDGDPDLKAYNRKEVEEERGGMIYSPDEEVVKTQVKLYKVETEDTFSESFDDSLLYGEEVMFFTTTRDNPDRGMKLHHFFPVDIRSCMRRWPIRASKPVSKAIQKVTKGRNSTLRNSLGRFEAPKYEVVTVPAVDKVFSGPEWKSFNHRQRVKTILSQFSFLVSYYRSQSIRTPHLAAGKYLRAKRFCFNEGKSVVGSIPGVRVGDKFKFREELLLLIVTRTTQAGIEYIPASESDYVGKDGRRVSVAVSVVCSGGYKDNEDDGESLVYVGSGGHKNLVKSSGATDQKEKDQKLVRGNLALRNSSELGVPVRVIRGEMHYEDNRRMRKRYCYDGLYDVKKYYKAVGSAGSKVWKFLLVKRKKQAVMLFNP
ncbi:hypothetical protein R1sor_012350 [Riccia sorocarpa]|uniref:YDG domain-containing protein n=1 Tax=Riccia sorocarpa TaxID=122646 RepID=A0ABD3I5D1_9MARC